MKRIIAGMLAFVVSVAFALAETTQTVTVAENTARFDVTVELPQDATVTVTDEGDVPFSFITFADETLPRLYISVASSELYDENSLNDFTPEETDALVDSIGAAMDEVTYSLRDTAAGYRYLLVQNQDAAGSAVLVVVFDGYFINLVYWHPDFSVLFDADTAYVLSVLDTMTVIPLDENPEIK